MQGIEFDGQACWLFGIKDITERKQAERLVQEREALLSLTIEAAALALWDLNMQTGEVWATASGANCGACPCQPRRGTERWAEVVHPDDRWP
jgi:PAS domain-containing protein